VAGFWIRCALAGVAAALTAAAHASMQVLEPADATRDAGALERKVPAIAFGFEALIADYRWLQAVQLVGHEHADLIGNAPAMQRLVEAVVALDPWVGHPYRFAANWLVNTPEQVRGANRILERGIAYHPDDWRNRFYLSFNHFFYLDDPEAAARELEPAIRLEGAPKYLGRLHARLRSTREGIDAAAVYLNELLRQTEDPWKRVEYEKALDEIETERRARVLDAARAAFKARRGRDIKRVEELAEGPDRVLAQLPPDLHGWGWVLDPESGEIESAYYERRYRVSMQPMDRERQQRWAESERASASEGVER
jgi:hypothetical protein